MIQANVILDQVACGVVVVDAAARVVYANDWFLRTVGVARDQASGAAVSDLLIGYRKPPVGPAQSRQALTIATAKGTRLSVVVFSSTIDAGPEDTATCLSILPQEGPSEPADVPPVPPPEQRDRLLGLVGRSPRMQEVFGFIEMAADTDANVVIQGESGTGKELVASAIHLGSQRRDKRFVRVNCASLTETLLESELFGHAKGAFTGAYRDHVGKFEYADQGTLFLDEIGEISPAMQAKLLRVLQERVIVRVGDNHETHVDVRVVIATNKNLRALVTKGKFREDLFYRLNVFPIYMPPLRERGGDVPLLIEHFIEKFRARTGKPITSCSADAMRILMTYCWPGNVRELENTIEHAFVLCRTGEIQVPDLPYELRVVAVREGICAEKVAALGEQTFHPTPVRAKGSRLTVTREALQDALAQHDGNKAATARALGISKVGLWKKMKKLGMM